MKTRLPINTRTGRVIQLSLIYFWISGLSGTNAYYSVYTLVALAAAAALLKLPMEYGFSWNISNGLILFCSGVLSFAVSLANYHLYQNIGFFDMIFAALGFLGGVVSFGNIILFVYHFFPLQLGKEEKERTTKGCVLVFISVLVSVVVINTLYLMFGQYPGNVTTDSVNQINQVITGAYSNHHPYWHTMTIKPWIEIALNCFGDIHIGAVLYAIWQSLFLGVCFGYAAMTLYQAGYCKWIVAVVALYYVLAPYNISFGITMWKDIPFGGAVLLFLVAAYRIFHHIGKREWLNYTVFVLGSMGFCLWRSNGWMASLATFLVVILLLNKSQKKMLMLWALTIVISWAMKGPYLESKGIPQPDFVENLSIPVQQIARTICDGGNITDAEYAALEIMMDVDQVQDLYLDYLSDPIKDEIRSKGHDWLVENKTEFLKMWFEIGLRNPKSYLHAWIDQTRGYWNGGYDYYVTTKCVDENTFGMVKQEGNNPIAYLFHRYIFSLQEIPAMNPIFSIGLHIWIVAVLFLCNALHLRKEALLCLPVLAIVGTLWVATPVSYEFRYAYSVFTAIPFLLAISMYKQSETQCV